MSQLDFPAMSSSPQSITISSERNTGFIVAGFAAGWFVLLYGLTAIAG
jgi:hypothetical protein